MIDADGSTDGREIIPFVGALVTGADFVKGSRYAAGGGSDDLTLRPPLRQPGPHAASSTGCTAPSTPTCATATTPSGPATWTCSTSTATASRWRPLMNIRAAKAGLKVHEVPSHERNRIHGESNLRAVRDGLRVLKTILREWRRQPAPPQPEPAAAPAADRGVAYRRSAEHRGSLSSSASTPRTAGRTSGDAVESVARQRRRPHELILVVDHNPDLHLRLKRRVSRTRSWWRTRHEQGLSGGKNTGVADAPPATSSRSSTTTRSPTPAGWRPSRSGFARSRPSSASAGAPSRCGRRGAGRAGSPRSSTGRSAAPTAGMPAARAPIRNVMGGNAAFRREVVVRGRRLPHRHRAQRAGPQERPLGCEETEFCIRLTQRRPGSVHAVRAARA